MKIEGARGMSYSVETKRLKKVVKEVAGIIFATNNILHFEKYIWPVCK